MRKIRLMGVMMLALLLITTVSMTGQRGDDANRKSKNGKVEGIIDGVNVLLEYGSPKVNGREIWGGLVPFDKIWRTGADEATQITINKDANVEGKKLGAGSYSLFTIPGKKEWTIVFNTVAKQWGAFRYDETKDALRITVIPAPSEHVEEMTFHIKGNKVVLRWEKLSVPFHIEAIK